MPRARKSKKSDGGETTATDTGGGTNVVGGKPEPDAGDTGGQGDQGPLPVQGQGGKTTTDIGEVDLFVCCFKGPTDEQAEVVDRWGKVYGVGNIRVLIPSTAVKNPMAAAQFAANLGLDQDQLVVVPMKADDKEGMGFQRMRRVMAEHLAQSAIYILADDDCTIDGPMSVIRSVHLMQNPDVKDFGILTPMPSNANIYPWTPERDEYPAELWPVYQSSQIMEHVDVGGIRFVRKGAMPEESERWLPQPDNRGSTKGWTYDRLHAAQMRSRGWRVGILRWVEMVHHGERNPISKEPGAMHETHTVEKHGTSVNE